MALAFTDCDHIFDSTQARGKFSLPIFPQPPTLTQGRDLGLDDSEGVLPYDETAYRSTMKGYRGDGNRILPNNIQVGGNKLGLQDQGTKSNP